MVTKTWLRKRIAEGDRGGGKELAGSGEEGERG
jgi:hypothetical protein